MKKIINRNRVSNLTASRQIECYCPLGDQNYQADIIIDIEPDDFIPEYIELTEYLDSFNKKEFTIEDLVGQIYKDLKEEFEPKMISISVAVPEGKHCAVEVIKF